MSDESPTYDDILIPTDGSNRAERAISHGIELANQADATIHAIHVVDERRYGETPALSSYELALEELEEEGQRLTSEVAERADRTDLNYETAVTRGVPSEEIADYATDEDVDVVVMGRAGAGGAEAPHMGSVTDRVLRMTEIPVFPV